MVLLISSCKNIEENKLLGAWKSNDILLKHIKKDYKAINLTFTETHLIINDKKIPVIYKIKEKKIILFSRGDKLIVHIKENGSIVLFLIGIGKRQYRKIE